MAYGKWVLMALNPAIKLSIGIYAICAILSFLNACGAIHTDTSNMQLDTNESRFNEMLDPSALNDGDPLTVQQEQYQMGSFDMVAFIKGSVYIKGTIDELAHYNPIVGLATGIVQAMIYILTSWGVISWVLNRNT